MIYIFTSFGYLPAVPHLSTLGGVTGSVITTGDFGIARILERRADKAFTLIGTYGILHLSGFLELHPFTRTLLCARHCLSRQY